MNTTLHDTRVRIGRDRTSQAIVNDARRDIEEQRARFIQQMVRHYTNGERGHKVRIIEPTGTMDKALFVDGELKGSFVASKEWLVFSVHNDASPSPRRQQPKRNS